MAEAMLPGFIPPCLPTKAKEPPCGAAWVHEIKHDGFRIIARKDGSCVRLFTRNGRDFTHRFALIVEALARLRSRSCIIDGEAVACSDDGVPSFDRIRYRRHDASVFLYAFDLRLNEHLEHEDGAIVFRHACQMGLEGIVSKRRDSPYRSGHYPTGSK
jgi:bifunctional non-homologous end joining protein LigD